MFFLKRPMLSAHDLVPCVPCIPWSGNAHPMGSLFSRNSLGMVDIIVTKEDRYGKDR